MSIKKLKAIINQTECKDFLYSGFFCSEPIMTKDEKGEIIDNYFIYTRSDDLLITERPEICFGIYSEKAKVAYIDKEISSKFEKKEYEENYESIESMKASMSIYTTIFPNIREMYEGKCRKDIEVIAQYIESLRTISGKALFNFYLILFPSFFGWAECEVNK